MKDKFSNIIVFLKKTWIIFLAAAIVAVAGVSSVEIFKEEVLKIDPDIEYVEAGSLSFACETIDTLNPLISQSEDVYYLSKLLYNSLFDFDENLNVVKELVDKYSVDTGRGKVTITLRKGVKWHNGDKLTASDVRFTVNAIQYAGSKSPYYEKASKISYVSVRGDYELDIYFKNAYDAALDDLTFPIVPSAQYGSAGIFATKEDNFKPIGTGQYQYRSYDYLKRLRLKPNEDYFGDLAVKNIDVMILPDDDLASNMLEIQSVTCYMDRTSERKSTVIDKELTLYDIPSNEAEFLVFYPYGNLVKEKKIRQAIAYAINENNVLENGYMSDGILTDTIYYPNFMGVEDTGGYYQYNVEKSLALMNDLGYEDKDHDGILEDQNGQELELKMIVNKNNATRLAAARLIKNDLENAGFKVILKELSWKDYKTAVSRKTFDILVTGYSIEETYDLRSFFNGRNDWNYYNYEMYSAASELEKLHTAKEYAEIFAELKELMLDELPYYSLCYKQIGLVGIQGFTAEKLPMFNDPYKNCETWFWEYPVEVREETRDEGAEE